jgi:hypothetical protein
MSGMTKNHEGFSVSAATNKGENRTEWDFEFWCKLDGPSHLRYTARSRIVPKTPEMEDENGWKRLDEHLLACMAQAG